MRATLPVSSIGGGVSSGSTMFGRLAAKTSQLAGKGTTFLLATAVVVLWAITGPIFQPHITSNCRRGFSTSCRLPFMFVTGRAWFSDTTAALPNYGAGRLRLAIPMKDFADRIEFTAPTAVCSRIINAPWPMCCAPVFPCANRKFTLSAPMVCAVLRSLTIEAIRDGAGNIVGAVNCFQEARGRTRKDTLARDGSSCEEFAGTHSGHRASHAS
jgi:Low affinity iron permease